jgi:metal transporter CNNM
MNTALIWLGVLFCLSQSALFSGLNLALFSLSKLELEVEAKKQNPQALRVLRLRRDSNFALVTILWGNVAVNVLLALLSGSILTGVAAFLFSTVVITLFAEIAPQAYFSRHALRIGSLFSPVLRVYQFLLFPIAKPTAWALDRWLGGEEIHFFRERDLRRVIQLHMDSADSDIARVEGQGALNFLDIDDIPLVEEGEPLHPDSITPLEFDGDRPVFPPITASPDDPFLRRLQQSGKTWAILTDAGGEPRLALRTDDFIREALFSPDRFDPRRHVHRPILLREAGTKLGDLMTRFRVRCGKDGTEIIENDVLLLWIDPPRIVTGTDLLGRLLRNIARPDPTAVPKPPPADSGG